MRPLLADVHRLGVLCVASVKPTRELDTEKLVARLSAGLTQGLTTIPGVTVVSPDEIGWHVKDVVLDSAVVIAPASRAQLVDSLQLDALVLVELQRVEARTTPMAPTPYGLASSPGLDLAINTRVALVNLHTGQLWQQASQQRDWKPRQPQYVSDDAGERPYLAVLGRPVEQFLLRVAPPPRRQERWFDLGEDDP